MRPRPLCSYGLHSYGLLCEVRQAMGTLRPLYSYGLHSYGLLCEARQAWDGETAPTFVFRETAPQMWKEGRLHFDSSSQQCEAWPDDWIESSMWDARPWDGRYSPYNAL